MKMIFKRLKNRKPVIAFVVFICVMLIIPMLYRYEKIKPFNTDLLNELKNYDPEVVFIGNSMLYTRIDAEYYSQLSGKRSFLLKVPGLTSAGWYLLFKNFVTEMNNKPDVVYIFFRDTLLTDPSFRTTGKYLFRLQRISHRDDVVFRNIVFKNKTGMERFEFYIGKIYPFLSYKIQIDRSIKNANDVIANSLIAGEFSKDEINQLFDLNNFRSVQSDGENINSSDDTKFNNFRDRLPGSFLPLIVDMAKKKNIKVVFVRVQKRPVGGIPPYQSPELIEYISELKSYIESNNLIFYDFTGDSRITLEMYGSGDHINEKSMKKYTKLFHDSLKDKIKVLPKPR